MPSLTATAEGELVGGAQVLLSGVAGTEGHGAKPAVGRKGDVMHLYVPHRTRLATLGTTVFTGQGTADGER